MYDTEWKNKKEENQTKVSSSKTQMNKKRCLWSGAKLLFFLKTFSRGFYFPCVEPSEK